MGTKRRINKLFYSMLIPLVSCTLANNFLIVSSTQIHAYADELIDDFESSIMASRHTPTIADDFKDNRIIVTLKSQYSEVNSRANIQSFRTSDRSLAFEAVEDLTFITDTSKIINKEGFSQIFSITLQEHSKENVLRAIDELEKLDQVLAAEPDYNFTAVDDWAPDDTRYNEQWGLRGTNGIQAELAWNFTRGDVTPRIQIGIFEGAFQANHEDLRTFTGNFNPNPGAAQNHGTHVAGIIGAIGNNDQGITGVTQAEICLLNRNDFVGSLTWAINHGIRIINASFRYLSGNIVNGIDEPAAAVVNHATAIRNFGSNGAC